MHFTDWTEYGEEQCFPRPIYQFYIHRLCVAPIKLCFSLDILNECFYSHTNKHTRFVLMYCVVLIESYTEAQEGTETVTETLGWHWPYIYGQTHAHGHNVGRARSRRQSRYADIHGNTLHVVFWGKKGKKSNRYPVTQGSEESLHSLNQQHNRYPSLRIFTTANAQRFCRLFSAVS